MEFKYHVLIGFTISYILVQFFGLPLIAGIIIFLTSWLIDIDHYFWYGFEMKDWNPVHAINWYLESTPRWIVLSTKQKMEFKKGIFIFHTIEFWVILLAVALFSKFSLWILIGIVVHMTADIIDLRLREEPVFQSKLSLISIIRRNKNKKRLDEL